MSSAALKIVLGLKESAAEVKIGMISSAVKDAVRNRDRRILELERWVVGLQYDRDMQEGLVDWWLEECQKTRTKVEILQSKIRAIQSRYKDDCGYFSRGKCHRKTCLCAETCKVD